MCSTPAHWTLCPRPDLRRQRAPQSLSRSRREDELKPRLEARSLFPPVTTHGGTLGAVNYSGDHGAWGWMVSPRANISTNWLMRLERVSGFLAFPIL